jgi:hypothetical protein
MAAAQASRRARVSIVGCSIAGALTCFVFHQPVQKEMINELSPSQPVP